ncbi:MULTISPECIES: hypothetical protein [unclassified Streptomyces]|uniref:hypothetical protein n=1 Tax=unclassified Streptomyces TaxID=2593676 RepID=UPI0007ED4ACF|nr:MULTISPECIES: hypothetical protein [unclassified Streptomyces]MCP3766668.1 hypothetical protein [Streptomyces sp. MAR25Y5]OBQ51232.1 hypothetical protein A4U61_14180 [Streptomyces sp. H-KF8]
MARHAVPGKRAVRRALAALATAGVALGAGATAAAADSEASRDAHTTAPASLGAVDPQAGVQPLTGAVGHAAGPVADLKPNPLAGTGVDPLDNGVGTQVADFRPVDSREVTGPVAQAESVDGLPVAGRATGMLGG